MCVVFIHTVHQVVFKSLAAVCSGIKLYWPVSGCLSVVSVSGAEMAGNRQLDSGRSQPVNHRVLAGLVLIVILWFKVLSRLLPGLNTFILVVYCQQKYKV